MYRRLLTVNCSVVTTALNVRVVLDIMYYCTTKIKIVLPLGAIINTHLYRFM